jgi:hypothetical protein
MRRKAVELSIPCLTSLDTANALANCLKMQKTINDVELVDIVKIKKAPAYTAGAFCWCALPIGSAHRNFLRVVAAAGLDTRQAERIQVGCMRLKLRERGAGFAFFLELCQRVGDGQPGCMVRGGENLQSRLLNESTRA